MPRSGQASVLIRGQDSAGNVTKELKTDSQKFTGDSLFWRFHNTLVFEDFFSLEGRGGRVSTLSFHLATDTAVQGDRTGLQAPVFVVSRATIDSLFSLTPGEGGDRDDKNSTCIVLEGKMCRSDVVHICAISVAVNRC